MSTRSLIALIIVASLTFYAGALTGAQQPRDAAIEEQLLELLHERHETLEKRLEILHRTHETGNVRLTDFITAQEDLLQAKLQLTTDPEERLQLLQQRVENMRLLEQRARANEESGVGTPSDTLAAMATRLQAQIDLVRDSH